MFDILFGWRKASKCKKLVKKVQCRLKLLKNKRRCIAKQVREDVAELLKNGHDQSAFERVEQLIMDENMVQVYDLLDQFCEFIVFNLPYIRKHRDCPNDINEAVSTLIFSSARFGELPELLPIRKLFGDRYSQRFVTIALELLPGNLVNNQIKENLYMKKVSDDVKYRFLDEIARSWIQSGPLLLEYKQQLQHDQIMWTEPFYRLRNGYNLQQFDPVREEMIQEVDSSSEYSSKMPEEVIYLDDIEEFVPPLIKDGNLQDQRLFMFRSFGEQIGHDSNGVSIEISLSSSINKRRASRKRSRRLSSSTDVQCAIYYGGSDETSPDKNRRKSCFKTEERNRVLGHQDHACNYLCTKDGNEAKGFSMHCLNADSDNAFVRRAITLPSERQKDCAPTDSIDRSISFPCPHIHPKLPDYDELAAKFMELKRANIQKQKLLK
ncbi:hypothetical protein ACS0TY_017721 [Phlomoides rotata]